QSAGEFLNHIRFEFAQLIEINLRLTKVHAPVRRMSRFIDNCGDMQQRLRWNATHVKTNSTRVFLPANERDLHTEISGQKSGGVSTRPSAEDCDIFCFGQVSPEQ